MCWVQTRHPHLSPGSGTRGLQPWVPRDCNNQKHSFRRLPPPGYCTDSRLKSIPCFSGKKKLCIPESPAESQKVQICYTRASEALLESKPNNAILHSSSASLQLARSSQKGTCTLMWIIHFCNWHPGDTCRSLGLEGSKVKVAGPQDCPGSPESPK